MVVVRDFVGEVRELRFEPGLVARDEALADVAERERILVRAMLQDAFAAFEAQVQTVEIRVMLLELVDDAQALQVVLEAAEIEHALVERILARMAERRVAEVVREAYRLGQRFVELERARDRARDLRDLERMGQARPIQIALVVDEHLGLVDEAAERRRVHDAIAVSLIFGSICGLGLGVAPAARTLLVRRVGREAGHPKYSASVAANGASA